MKTFSDFYVWFELSYECAQECLPFSVFASGNLTPPGWDSPGVASCVHNAVCLGSWSDDARNLCKIAIERWDFRGRKGALQSNLYSILVDDKSSDWSDLLLKRLTLYNSPPPLPISSSLAVFLKDLASNIKKIPLSRRIVVMRTITNGWSTSSRYHERTPLPCVFGCLCFHPLISFSGKWDSLEHYLKCPRLNAIVARISGLSGSLCTHEKLCLLDGASDLWCWLSHGMYHFVKHSRYSLALQANHLDVALKLCDEAERYGIHLFESIPHPIIMTQQDPILLGNHPTFSDNPFAAERGSSVEPVSNFALTLNDVCLRDGKYLIDSLTPTPNSTLRTHPPPVSLSMHDNMNISQDSPAKTDDFRQSTNSSPNSWFAHSQQNCKISDSPVSVRGAN